MASTCIVCQKSSLRGNNIRHKAQGGWALKAPKTRKFQKPNLRTLRINGKLVGQVCMKCYKSLKAEL